MAAASTSNDPADRTDSPSTAQPPPVAYTSAITRLCAVPGGGPDSVRAVIGGEHPDVSPVGIALAIGSIIFMPILGIAKQRLANQLGSAATAGEGRQNMLCAYLAGALLVGLIGNALVGAWWLDPLVGLLIAAVADQHGIERPDLDPQLLRSVHRRLGAEDGCVTVAVRHADGRIVAWNRSAERIFGRHAEDVVGTSMRDLFPEHVRDDVVVLLDTVAGGARVDHVETEVARRDGMRIPISVSLRPVCGADGSCCGVVGVARDLTEQRLTQSALARAA